MAGFEYEYSQIASSDRLKAEITAEVSITATLSYINIDMTNRRTLIGFSTELSSAEKVTLDSLMWGHLQVVTNRDILKNKYITAEKTSTSARSLLCVEASTLFGRGAVEVVNTGNVVLYIGDSTVTTSGSTRGRPVNPKASYAVCLGGSVDLYIISASDCTYVVVEAR